MDPDNRDLISPGVEEDSSVPAFGSEAGDNQGVSVEEEAPELVDESSIDLTFIFAKDEAPEFENELGLDMIDIFVGPKPIHFRVHEKLLSTKSGYFRSMLDGKYKEAIERTIHMPEDSPTTFSLFLKWLYGDDLKHLDKQTTKNQALLRQRIELYAFGEKIFNDHLMNCVISSIIRICRIHEFLPSACLVEFAYNNTREASLLRAWMCRVYIHALYKEDDEDFSMYDMAKVMETVEDLRMDMITLFRAKNSESMSEKSPFLLDSCSFHHHDNEECAYADPEKGFKAFLEQIEVDAAGHPSRFRKGHPLLSRGTCF
ncbi:uncharacterized protein LY89DRAFT_759536 [Mollisia scopiformis]|uniref:BTB domain-containing protein n=1 Tax=Mollisia scopiformis TaxID=149040 RepID=A0A194WRM2_MOLSC|nr:uncharacterized protein LY89DRAFT_759536 [Mollisia scopiformis]KUJ10651.1 hypothetical protein LY89DRAFT_759536 [Mollisia scopiformis]